MLANAPRRARPRRKAAGQYHHGELRAALIAATLAIVERDGSGAVSLSAAARKVGVSPQATYSHFRDKGELLAAVAEQAVLRLEGSVRAARDAASGPLVRLEATAIAYARFAQAHVAQFRLLSTPELVSAPQATAYVSRYPALRAAYERAFEVLLSAVEDCQRAGLLRAGEPRALAVSAWAMVHGVSRLIVDGLVDVTGYDDVEALMRDAVRMLFRGMRQRGD